MQLYHNQRKKKKEEAINPIFNFFLKKICPSSLLLIRGRDKKEKTHYFSLFHFYFYFFKNNHTHLFPSSLSLSLSYFSTLLFPHTVTPNPILSLSLTLCQKHIHTYIHTMQDIFGSVRRSLVFRTAPPESDDSPSSPSPSHSPLPLPLVDKINSCIRKSRVFSKLSSPPPPPTPPPIRWRKGELIGCGAFGRVYMGMNLDSGELLAVKQVAL